MALRFYNTASKKTEVFKPLAKGEVRMYHCGPTVYGPQHIGNLSMFVFTDVLRRTLEAESFAVRQVINFTDFGHLSSDADEGEDKMAIGLKREALDPTVENMHKLGQKYAEIFLGDLSLLNINTQDTIFPYASQYVGEQISLIETLEDKGFAYTTSDGVYFDTSKYADYGRLGGLVEEGARERISLNDEKRNPRDFALWKFNTSIGWESRWGRGFPGWHIECSAMIIKLLGEEIDIHTGGIEHIAVHHNNEIAQSEAATGKKPFAHYWLHRAHLRLDGEKVAKSVGNTLYLKDIVLKGYGPLIFRYFLLLSHYRTPANFTWEALGAAENAYKRLKEFFSSLSGEGKVYKKYHKEFMQALEDDLNTSKALSVTWQLVKDEKLSSGDKRATLLEMDKVLGLDLLHNEYLNVPESVIELGRERELARSQGDFAKADNIRQEIEAQGYEIRDAEGTFVIFRQ